MAVLEPQSNITLVNVPWDNNYQNVRNFNDIGAQGAYFSNLFPRINFEDYTYLRKGSSIRVGVSVDEIREYNYLYYNNGDGKTYYCFIEDYNYISENVTELIIKIDVYQTYMFEYTILKSFVEREHVTLSSDIPGKYTFPEELETGEYVCYERQTYHGLKNQSVIIQIGKNPYDTNATFQYGQYGGVYMFGYLFAFDVFNERKITQDVQRGAFTSLMNKIRSDGLSENIFAIYVVPTETIGQRDDHNMMIPSLESVYSSIITNIIPSDITRFNQFNYNDIYTPKNKKLLTYPYKYFAISNNSGILNTYRYEDFDSFYDIPDENKSLEMKIKFAPTIGGSCKLVPLTYKGQDENEDEGIMLGKFPTYSWGNDTYTNWLTQNALNVVGNFIDAGLNTIKGSLAMGYGASDLVGLGYSMSSYSQVYQTAGKVYEQKFAPNTIGGNIAGGDINSISSMNTFIFSHMEIKPEYAEIIDNFFEMYGYKINKLKVPETTSRKYWNYVKTIDINMEGNIPETDLTELKNIFNNGVTIWHTNNMYNYSLNNHESI